MINLQQITTEICTLARETGSFIATERSKFNTDKIEIKGHNNFVSYVDKVAEEQIVTVLSQLLPEAGFIAEEGTSNKKGARYNWVIDPLDGTTNFIHGLPPYAISIALLDNNEVVAGVVYEIVLNECFYAWQGSKAYLNGSEITVSGNLTVSQSLIATGFPYYDFGKTAKFLESLNHLFQHSHGVRRIGSAATDLAYVACGRFDAFYEYGLQPWDVAAGVLIIKQAGGCISDFSNQNNYIFGGEIIATNSLIHAEFSGIIAKYLR